MKRFKLFLIKFGKISFIPCMLIVTLVLIYREELNRLQYNLYILVIILLLVVFTVIGNVLDFFSKQERVNIVSRYWEMTIYYGFLIYLAIYLLFDLYNISPIFNYIMFFILGMLTGYDLLKKIYLNRKRLNKERR